MMGGGMSGTGRRLASLTRKELHQLRRDPILLILTAWLFTIEVVLCAYALTFDLNDAPVAVEDLDHTPASRALIDRLDRSRDFRVAALATEGRAELQHLLDRGEALAVVRIPEGWSRALHGRGAGEVQILVDGADVATGATVRGYLEALVHRQGAETTLRARGSPPRPLVESRTRVWFNSGLKTVYFMVLSMIALAAILVGVIHPAASLVREKETGTLEQLLVSPARPGELLLAKLAVTLLASLAGLVASLGIVAWFGVPVRGSIVVFFLVSVVFLVSAIGLGILVATFARNLQQALLLAFFGLIPVMFLSGTMVPIEAMPRAVQLASLASPLRYYMDCLLGIFLKGSGWRLLWPQVAAMGGLGTIVLGLGLWRLGRWLRL
jgi:ABC-2 type transport system permease protein